MVSVIVHGGVAALWGTILSEKERNAVVEVPAEEIVLGDIVLPLGAALA